MINTAKGSSASPLYFFTRVGGSDFDSKTYMLDRILMININRGNVKVEINGKEFSLTAQNFVFLPPHSNVHVIKASYDLEASVVGFVMALQEMVMQKLGHAFFTYVFRQMVWQLSDNGKKVLNAFCILYEDLCSRQPDVYSADIANSMFNIFLLTFYQNVRGLFAEDDKNSVNSKSLAARFAFLLHEHFKQEHSVAFYADRLCISSKYLTQIIKANTGFTPKVAIDRSLGIEALFLLGNTSYNIQEISNQLGFPDQSYFGRFFKRLFGLSPLHYRMNPDFNLLQRLRDERGEIENMLKK